MHHTTLASHVSDVCIEKNVEHLINFSFLEGKSSVWDVNCAGFWGNLKVALCDSLGGGFCVEYGGCLYQRCESKIVVVLMVLLMVGVWIFLLMYDIVKFLRMIALQAFVWTTEMCILKCG